MFFFKKFMSGFFLIAIVTLLFYSESMAQNPPELLFPTSNSTCVERMVPFQWSPATGALSYTLQIATADVFIPQNIIHEATSLTSTTYTYTLPEANKTYYWHVLANYPGGQAWSATWQFKTKYAPTTLNTPINNAQCQPKRITLTWNTQANDSIYRLQISVSDSFPTGDIIFQYANLTSNSKIVDMPNYFKKYYWRVRTTFKDECVNDWSNVYSYSIQQAPGDPLYPADAAIGIALTDSLKWSSISPVDFYTLQVATDVNFTSMILNQANITNSFYEMTFPAYNTKYYWRVRSHYQACVSTWSAVFSLKTQYPQPVQRSPQDGRICFPLTEDFEWDAVNGAQSYRLQIATDSNFTNLVVNVDQIFGIKYKATLPNGLTDYLWRVRAEDNTNAGKWSTLRKLRTTIKIPELLEPAQNAGGVPVKPLFKWKNMGAGALYRFQVSDKADFSSLIKDAIDISSTTYTITLPVNNTNYYWRVSASFTPCQSDFSEGWMFKTVIKAPTLVFPANNSLKQSLNINFRWTAVADADSYTLVYSTDSTFKNTTGYSGILATTRLVTGLQPNSTYFWKISATNSDGTSDYSQTFKFKTNYRGAEIPLLESPPIAAEKLPVDVILKWRKAARAVRYHLQVALNDNFINPLVNDETLTDTTYALNGLQNNATYYWHVSAINDSGETAFSRLGYFRTIALAPNDKPVLVAPVDDSTDANINLVLQWEETPRATMYDVQVGTDITFLSGLFADDNECIYLTKNLYGLEYNTTYYWRIRGKNEGGMGPWSDPWKFNTLINSVSDADKLKYAVAAYPNPLNEDTKICFNLPDAGRVTVKIYNLMGQEVSTLVNDYLSNGTYNYLWTPGNLDNGMYWCRIQIGNYQEIKELILLR